MICNKKQCKNYDSEYFDKGYVGNCKISFPKVMDCLPAHHIETVKKTNMDCSKCTIDFTGNCIFPEDCKYKRKDTTKEAVGLLQDALKYNYDSRNGWYVADNIKKAIELLKEK